MLVDGRGMENQHCLNAGTELYRTKVRIGHLYNADCVQKDLAHRTSYWYLKCTLGYFIFNPIAAISFVYILSQSLFLL